MKNRIIAILSVIIGLLPMVARAQDGSYHIYKYTYVENLDYDDNRSIDSLFVNGDYYYVIDIDNATVTEVWSWNAGEYDLGDTKELFYSEDRNVYHTLNDSIIFTEDLSTVYFYVRVGEYAGCVLTDEFDVPGEKVFYLYDDMDSGESEDESLEARLSPYKAPGIWHYVLFILLAILPGAVLFAFIRWRDRLRPEPVKELLFAFIMGVLTILPAIGLEILISKYNILYPNSSLWLNCSWIGFICAALPEELVKISALILFFRWRKHQNEFMDGIVYAACIGLGFALAENIKYIVSTLEASGVGVAVASTTVVRALMAVPCHFGCGILMGYFFSYFLFIPARRWLSLALAFLTPFIFHGIYDSLLYIYTFSKPIQQNWTFVFMFAFFAIFFYVNQLCVKAIRSALKTDSGIK